MDLYIKGALIVAGLLLIGCSEKEAVKKKVAQASSGRLLEKADQQDKGEDKLDSESSNLSHSLEDAQAALIDYIGQGCAIENEILELEIGLVLYTKDHSLSECYSLCEHLYALGSEKESVYGEVSEMNQTDFGTSMTYLKASLASSLDLGSEQLENVDLFMACELMDN
jgi:hypothetical protein